MRRNFKLTPEQIMDCREAIRILDGTGILVSQAARLAVGNNPGAVVSVDYNKAVMEFMKSRKAVAGSTRTFYLNNLQWLYEEIGDDKLTVDKLRPDEVKEILSNEDLAADTCLSRWRAVRAFVRWCGGKGYTSADWGKAAPDMESISRREFLPVEEVERLFASPGKYLHTYTLGFYAGVRQHEIRGDYKEPLRFEHVNPDERFIRIPPEISKTGRRRGARIIEGVPDKFWSLWKGAPKEGDICPHSITAAVDHARGVLGYWKQNAARHTFATYHVNAYQNPGLTCLILGHDEKPTMLNKHYKGNEIEFKGKRYVATKGRGEQYFR